METPKFRPGNSFACALGVLAAHLVLFASLATLLVLTLRDSGFAASPTVKSSLLDSFGMDWEILWQTVPPFLISLFALYRNSAVDNAAYHITHVYIKNAGNAAPSDRPSNRSKQEERASLLGEPSDKRIFNYLEKWSLTRGLHAYRNGDFNLMTGFILGAIVTFILQPLMGSLIKEQESLFSRNVTTYRPVIFDGRKLGDLKPYEWNLILGSVIAEDLHNGKPSPWTNGTHAFRPFDLRTQPPDGGTLAAPSTAHTAHLSCERVTDVVLQLDDLGMKGGPVRVNITATDRNCSIVYDFNIIPANRPLVSQAFQQTACGYGNSISRVLILTATASASASGNETIARLDDTTLTSCITAYSSTDGELVVSWGNGTATATSGSRPSAADPEVPPTFVSFSHAAPVMPKKDFLQESFEGDLLGIREVQYGSPEDKVANTEFADFVMAVAAGLLAATSGSGSDLASGPGGNAGGYDTLTFFSSDAARTVIRAPDVLLRAMPLAFASIYRVAVAKVAMVPATAADAQRTIVAGRLETTETRLWVRYWLVAVAMAYLVLSAGSGIWLTRWWGWTVGFDVGAGEQGGIEDQKVTNIA
ncbi:hypothetical protein B0H67DRAFT_645715 [Lasiosphaeris hirsuta]|uniref:Uncharacterized protein n=1 Tax=Lasiosphaeris hirsuta TaxID=260670 RepID=A0AA40AHQ7_9PEZI|nr:hypothetical protein B0H67DRAFT_645715 [Lasiosphaeris hirsuta]